MKRKITTFIACIVFCLFAISTALAHPVPSENHDRSVLVRLTPTAIVVEYRLEVDESRAALDLPRSEQQKINSRDDLYNTFASYFGDFLAGNLVAYVDDKPLDFQCRSRRYTFRDELNQPLGHLRCDFRMEAAWNLEPDMPHMFRFRESNYELEDFNRVEVRLVAGDGLELENVAVPDDELLTRKPADFRPGDGERLRKASATFRLVPTELREEKPSDAVTAPPTPTDDSWSLLHLLLDTDQGVGVLLLLAVVLGGIHALTPGHGKTLVAAYLVGERGTVWHALLLGVVTTVTHTSAVMAVAAAVYFVSPSYQNAVLFFLEFGGGLAVVFLGLWLLYTRLAGRPDHVHLGGGHHHHHHGEHEHHHHNEEWAALAKSKPGIGALLILGITGGMVPCGDAIAVLAFAISAGRFALGLPLIVAFSVGLAGTLTAIGVSVVQARKFADSRWKESERFRRIVRALPVFSAAVITLLGFWLCYASVHPH